MHDRLASVLFTSLVSVFSRANYYTAFIIIFEPAERTHPHLGLLYDFFLSRARKLETHRAWVNLTKANTENVD